MQQSFAVGISFPKSIIEKIDEKRGDVSRSRYVLRILEKMDLAECNKERSYDMKKENSGFTGPSESGIGAPAIRRTSST